MYFIIECADLNVLTTVSANIWPYLVGITATFLHRVIKSGRFPRNGETLETLLTQIQLNWCISTLTLQSICIQFLYTTKAAFMP